MMKPVGVKIDDELQTRLKGLSECCDHSPHRLMKKAITEYVDRMEAEENERKLLLDRWHDYQETGEGIAHENVIEWFETWGREDESTCPTTQN